MSDTVTMFGKEMVPKHGGYMTDDHLMLVAPSARLVDGVPTAQWGAQCITGETIAVTSGYDSPQAAIDAAHNSIATLALRLPADVWARMVERRGEVDRG